MDLLPQHAVLPDAQRAVGAPGAPVTKVHGWNEALAMAQFRAGGAGPLTDGMRTAEEHELEACGVPASTGLPMQPLAPAPARSDLPLDEPVTTQPRRSEPAAAETHAVRVHVAAGEAQGLHVWLGVDGLGAPSPATAAAVLAGFAGGTSTGTERISLLVCNGTTVYVAAPVSRSQLSLRAPAGNPPDKETP